MRTEDPKESLNRTLATSSRDWGEDRADAWIYGVVCGWDDPRMDPDGEAMAELAKRHDWSPEEVARLRRLHAAFDAL